MTVFHYEWKRSRKYILIWGLSLAVCIFSMIPVYYSMIETPELLPKNFAEGGFFETVGISLALLLEPLGMYGFLNAFFALAGGIFGMHFALSLFTKECKVSLQRHNHKSQQKPSQPTLKRRCFFVKSDVFLWPGFRKEWC